MSGKSPRTRFLVRVMNPHAQVDRCIVPEQSEAFGKPGRVRNCSKVQNRGGQTFPKSTEIRNSVAFRAVFSVFFRPCFSVVAESVSEQLLQCTDRLGGQFWLTKESVSTSATDCRISMPICTKYGLQKVRTCKIDGLYY